MNKNLISNGGYFMDVKKIMKVRDVMIDEFETIRPEADIREAAEKMRQANLGALPVKSNGNLIGMITDRDITVRATATGKDPEQTTVKETMTPEINYL
jgi:CBS domain-containing protein